MTIPPPLPAALLPVTAALSMSIHARLQMPPPSSPAVLPEMVEFVSVI
jgi:hypothetical protein